MTAEVKDEVKELIVSGAENVDQLNANVKLTEVVLSSDDLKALDEISALPKEYPGWMVERREADRALKP